MFQPTAFQTDAFQVPSNAALSGAEIGQSGVSRLARHLGVSQEAVQYGPATRYAGPSGGAWTYQRALEILTLVQRLKGKIEQEPEVVDRPAPAPPKPSSPSPETVAKAEAIKSDILEKEAEALRLERSLAEARAAKTERLQHIARLETKLLAMAEAARLREEAEAEEEETIALLLAA